MYTGLLIFTVIFLFIGFMVSAGHPTRPFPGLAVFYGFKLTFAFLLSFTIVYQYHARNTEVDIEDYEFVLKATQEDKENDLLIDYVEESLDDNIITEYEIYYIKYYTNYNPDVTQEKEKEPTEKEKFIESIKS